MFTSFEMLREINFVENIIVSYLNVDITVFISVTMNNAVFKSTVLWDTMP
jgi:hypothetical protein